MDRETAERYINQLYEHVLGRKAADKEFEHWVATACSGRPSERIFEDFVTCKEYSDHRIVRPFFPPGHFYSPIVDPLAAQKYYRLSLDSGPDDLWGIHLNTPRMMQFWKNSLDFIKSTPFTENKIDENRYYYDNSNYPYGDAIILRAIIGCYKPARIIEIGSGFSSACMLDAADHAGLKEMRIVCIDPDMQRLRGVLRPADTDRVEIRETLVQEIPTALFSTLRANDILFIDSSHVLKTGSDVHYELFSILPHLGPGVLVHFHDIQYPFEYPEEWAINKNYSWNEIYAVRAFLMYNSVFEVIFWSSMFSRIYREEIDRDFPLLLKNPGGSLWLRRR